MFIEFLDQLRCTEPHGDSWLVASFAERDGRFIVAGTLGCPICYRQYPIVAGAAYFGVEPGMAPSATTEESDPELAVRAAAFLGARERATLVLAGEWASAAHAASQLVPMRIFALNPLTPVGDSELVGVMYANDAVPLTPGSVDGIALDALTAAPDTMCAAVSALRPGGRLVAPASAAIPPNVRELARDDIYWVGETMSTLVPLRRA